MPKPNLHRITVEPSKFEDSLKDLQQHQDRVRLGINEQRTHLVPLKQAIEPTPGEMLFDGNVVKVAVRGNFGMVEYRQVYPATQESTGIPAWFLERIKVFEDLLEAAGIPKEEWPYFGGI